MSRAYLRRPFSITPNLISSQTESVRAVCIVVLFVRAHVDFKPNISGTLWLSYNRETRVAAQEDENNDGENDGRPGANGCGCGDG